MVPLIQALKYGELDSRYGAAETLGEIGDERALEPLNQTLKDEEEEMLKKVAEVLVNMGWNSKMI